MGVPDGAQVSWLFTRKDGTSVVLSDFEMELIAPDGVMDLVEGTSVERLEGTRLESEIEEDEA